MEREEIFESKKHLIKRIKKFTKDLSLTEEELDVLGFIAYLQPINSKKLTELLGFEASSCISSLECKNLIMVACHHWDDDSELYGTTKDFLTLAHLKSISCLPAPDGKIPRYSIEKRKKPNRTFLESIDIHGFKCFKNKTHINFSPELNAIIGPNKVGKSSILKAIKWCFSKSKPEINDFFTGSEDIATMDFAEVKLTFSNGKKNEANFTIKRRIKKSRESKILEERFYNENRIDYSELDKRLDLNTLYKSFFLFDEIDLSIDDVNYPVFIDMLNHVKNEKQCIFVTRKKETCKESDTMIGVTAENDGLPKIIEVKM